MKRVISILLLTVLIACSAYADREWTCICGRVNTGNSCGKCGTSREDAQKAPGQEPSAASALKPGDHVTYGHYPQTAEGTDDTPIEWVVLDVQGDKALLLSRYGLDTKPYHMRSGNVTWETCTLREWLNSDFLNSAFSAEEQDAILTTDVDNGISQGYSGWRTTGGNDTQDKVFLLSCAEANRYLQVEYGMLPGSTNNTASRVVPTAYALKNGAFTNGSNKTAEGTAAGWWWLRSPGNVQRDAAHVLTDGSLFSNYAMLGNSVVRPAFWIDLR